MDRLKTGKNGQKLPNIDTTNRHWKRKKWAKYKSINVKQL